MGGERRVGERASFDGGRVSPMRRHKMQRGLPDSLFHLAGTREKASVLRGRNGAMPRPTHVLDRRRHTHVREANVHGLLESPRLDPKKTDLTGCLADAAENDLRVTQVNAHFPGKVDHAANQRFMSIALARIWSEKSHEWSSSPRRHGRAVFA